MVKTVTGDEPQNVDHSEDFKPVELPSGSIFHVYKDEVADYKEKLSRYLKDNDFENASDLMELDRILMLELLVQRYSLWTSTQANYWNEAVDITELAKYIKDFSTEIRNNKMKLRIDKTSRDADKGSEDVATWIANLLYRAKHFGIKRNKEFNEIIEIFQDLRGRVELYERCDEEERKEHHAGLIDIYRWLATDAFPRLDEIDRKFRQETPEGVIGAEKRAVEGGQQMWVTEM